MHFAVYRNVQLAITATTARIFHILMHAWICYMHSSNTVMLSLSLTWETCDCWPPSVVSLLFGVDRQTGLKASPSEWKSKVSSLGALLIPAQNVKPWETAQWCALIHDRDFSCDQELQRERKASFGITRSLIPRHSHTHTHTHTHANICWLYQRSPVK